MSIEWVYSRKEEHNRFVSDVFNRICNCGKTAEMGIDAFIIVSMKRFRELGGRNTDCYMVAIMHEPSEELGSNKNLTVFEIETLRDSYFIIGLRYMGSGAVYERRLVDAQDIGNNQFTSDMAVEWLNRIGYPPRGKYCKEVYLEAETPTDSVWFIRE